MPPAPCGPSLSECELGTWACVCHSLWWPGAVLLCLGGSGLRFMASWPLMGVGTEPGCLQGWGLSQGSPYSAAPPTSPQGRPSTFFPPPAMRRQEDLVAVLSKMPFLPTFRCGKNRNVVFYQLFLLVPVGLGSSEQDHKMHNGGHSVALWRLR